MTRETVGKISRDLSLKSPESHDPIELEREMHKDYEKHIYSCIDTCKKGYPADFYIVVIIKRERLMQNVLRNYFFGRLTCPMPDYDQTVYFFDRAKEQIQFLWVIPSKDACIVLKENAVQVVPEERELLKFVLDFADGTLYKLARQLNGEEPLPQTV